MNTETKRNWPSLIGLIFVAGAILYPFVSIGDNASPFDHFLMAGYGYENPDLDYGEFGKPLMMQALPFDGEVIEDPLEDVNSSEEGVLIEESIIDSTIESSDTIIDPITSELLTQPPTGGSVMQAFPNHMPQEYIGNGHQ